MWTCINCLRENKEDLEQLLFPLTGLGLQHHKM